MNPMNRVFSDHHRALEFVPNIPEMKDKRILFSKPHTKYMGAYSRMSLQYGTAPFISSEEADGFRRAKKFSCTN